MMNAFYFLLAIPCLVSGGLYPGADDDCDAHTDDDVIQTCYDRNPNKLGTCSFETASACMIDLEEPIASCVVDRLTGKNLVKCVERIIDYDTRTEYDDFFDNCMSLPNCFTIFVEKCHTIREEVCDFVRDEIVCHFMDGRTDCWTEAKEICQDDESSKDMFGECVDQKVAASMDNIIRDCAKKTVSADEPQTEAECVIEDEFSKALKLKILPECSNMYLDMYQGQCKFPKAEAAIGKCKPCICFSLMMAGQPVEFSDCY